MDKHATLSRFQFGAILRYLVVGGLTTGINVVLFFTLTHLGVAWFWANLAAWWLSVAFAFVANKTVVFNSATTAPLAVLQEALGFFGLRGASLAVDTAILFVGLSLLHAAPLVVKLVDQVVVIVLNYAFSKRLFSR
ncbi:GtrA family protein [Lacticaseibacillus parakribbianus]|uniref:GtrA family protein n=1 Tax=Lacticaseibacillus parakribbianus TaxID=2970927 RepID=UPI0021CAEFF6|nr:GtrA family protein [Lacticaseibacillus parakribbianus]